MKTTLVHDWLVSYRGGEKVLESLSKLFPEAPIQTLFYDNSRMPDFFQEKNIVYPKTLNTLRAVRRFLLPLLPNFIESLDLNEYDLVISTSSCVAKGVIPSPYAKHICYLHSPMRYIWDQQHHYFKTLHRIPLVRLLLNAVLLKLRLWDTVSSQRVDSFVVNSQFVKKRVERFYKRDSTVIHPPVDVEFFNKKVSRNHSQKSYFLIAGSFVPYKRLDIAIQACKELGLNAIVAGSGPLEKKLRGLTPENFEFIVAPSKETLRELLQHAEAFIFPTLEDFGIMPVEAIASGTPVIAYGRGGSKDFVVPGKTGVFFQEQTVDSLKNTLKNFKSSSFDKEYLKAFSLQFSESNFLDKMKSHIELVLNKDFL